MKAASHFGFIERNGPRMVMPRYSEAYGPMALSAARHARSPDPSQERQPSSRFVVRFARKLATSHADISTKAHGNRNDRGAVHDLITQVQTTKGHPKNRMALGLISIVKRDEA